MKEIKWKTETRTIGELIPHKHNPRTLTGIQRDFLKESLEKFGLVEIPVINTDNTLLAGHQRTKILLALYGKDYVIDVRVPSRKLTESEAKEYLIRSNKNTGSWDEDVLHDYFTEDELAAFGFTIDEITDIVGFEYEELPEVDIEGFQFEEVKYVKVIFETPEQLEQFRKEKGLTKRQRLIDYAQL